MAFVLDQTTGAIVSVILKAGDILPGVYNVGPNGAIRGGQTDFNVGTGFFLGATGGTYKFSIGDPAGQNLTWDGAILNVAGAINALSGSIAGVLNIGAAGGIFQGTGTFAVPTTALKIYNSGGIGLLEMWGAGVKQVYFDTSGHLVAGAGNVLMGSTGINVISIGTTPPTNAYLIVSKDAVTPAISLSVFGAWGSLNNFYTPLIAAANPGSWASGDLWLGNWHVTGLNPNMKTGSISIDAVHGDVTVFNSLSVGGTKATSGSSGKLIGINVIDTGWQYNGDYNYNVPYRARTCKHSGDVPIGSAATVTITASIPAPGGLPQGWRSGIVHIYANHINGDATGQSVAELTYNFRFYNGGNFGAITKISGVDAAAMVTVTGGGTLVITATMPAQAAQHSLSLYVEVMMDTNSITLA